jgi:hypothetical protein
LNATTQSEVKCQQYGQRIIFEAQVKQGVQQRFMGVLLDKAQGSVCYISESFPGAMIGVVAAAVL